MAEKYKNTDPLNLNLVSTSVGKRSFFIKLMENLFILENNYNRIPVGMRFFYYMKIIGG